MQHELSVKQLEAIMEDLVTRAIRGPDWKGAVPKSTFDGHELPNKQQEIYAKQHKAQIEAHKARALNLAACVQWAINERMKASKDV